MSKEQLEEATVRADNPDHSPGQAELAKLAHIAYVKLKLAPKTTPFCDRTPMFCCMPGKGRRMCGAKCAKNQDHLPYHIELEHGGPDENVPRGHMPRRKGGKVNDYEVGMPRNFYENVLMEDEDWPGKPRSRKGKASVELDDRSTSPTSENDQGRKR